MLRILLTSFFALTITCCSPEHRHGEMSTGTDTAGKGGGTEATGMPFSELVEKVFEPAGCFDCHGKYKKHETVLKTVIPGDATTSKLFLRASTDMPPIEEGYMPLSEEQIEIVREWIDQGANP